jgi:LacI family transcriptional regulator
VGTVSHVVNGSNEGLRRRPRTRSMSSIEELGFVRNAAARQLRSGRSSSLGLVVLDTSNPFFASIAHGARDTPATRPGSSLLIGDSGTDEARESKYLDLFAEQRVNGLLVTPSGRRSVETRVDLHPRNSGDARRPCLDRRLRTVRRSPSTMSPAAEWRSTIIIAGGSASPAVRRRTDVASPGGGPTHRGPRPGRRGLGARRCRCSTRMQLTILAGRSVGRSDSSALPADDQRPDAVFCANDLLAVGFMQAVIMYSASCAIPEDHRAHRLRRHRLCLLDDRAADLDPSAGRAAGAHGRGDPARRRTQSASDCPPRIVNSRPSSSSGNRLGRCGRIRQFGSKPPVDE